MKDTPRTHPALPTQGDIEFHAVTVERWADLAQLFEDSRSTSSGVTPGTCWCMVWREMPGEARRGATPAMKREALKSFVDAGTHVGILAYLDGRPTAWCSVAPRSTYARTDSFRLVGESYDAETSVWAIVCFYVAPESRGLGVQARLIEEACAVAVQAGADVVEALPVANGEDSWPYDYMGTARAFVRAGFEDAGSTRKHHRLMRRFV